MRTPVLIFPLLPMLLFVLIYPLKADVQMCISQTGPDHDCTFCSPGQNGMVKHGGFVYECVNGIHQGGPVACLTRFDEKATEEYKVIKKNRRGLYHPGRVGNCQLEELLQIKCLISPELACINPKARDCVSPKGTRVPLGAGIEEDGITSFCAIRNYRYQTESEYKWIVVAFLYDCRFDKADYDETYRLLNSGLNWGYTAYLWKNYCEKQEPKFILPISTSIDFLKKVECTYNGELASAFYDGQHTKTPDEKRWSLATIPHGSWKVIQPTYNGRFNVSCISGQTQIENCISEQGTPIPFGSSITEPRGIYEKKSTCKKESGGMAFLRVEEVITNRTSIHAAEGTNP